LAPEWCWWHPVSGRLEAPPATRKESWPRREQSRLAPTTWWLADLSLRRATLRPRQMQSWPRSNKRLNR